MAADTERGNYATVGELDAAGKVSASYLSRVPRLTLLAPDIVEAILDGRQAATMTLAGVMEPLPAEWPEQAEADSPSSNP